MHETRHFTYNVRVERDLEIKAVARIPDGTFDHIIEGKGNTVNEALANLFTALASHYEHLCAKRGL